MKKVMMLLGVLFLLAAPGMAQELKTSTMANAGQTGPSEEARYVLGLVRNNRADLLNKYFDQAPWKIQTEIDVYKNASKNASVSVFCVAVDLGYIDVVKSFVEHGIGPADLCRVQTFTSKRYIISKADRYIHDETTSTTRSSSSSGSKGFNVGWFGISGRSGGSSTSSTTTTTSTHDDEYHQVAYGYTTVVKTYMANPLDFAEGEMFDYLWEQGFRSNNLFTIPALQEARETGRREVYEYILDNAPATLIEKPSYISEKLWGDLLKHAKENPQSLMTELLIRQTLGKVKTSSQAKTARNKVEKAMQEQLAKQISDTVGNTAVVQELADTACYRPKEQLAKQIADTVGYTAIVQVLADKEAALAKQEREIAAWRKRAVDMVKGKANCFYGYWKPSAPNKVLCEDIYYSMYTLKTDGSYVLEWNGRGKVDLNGYEVLQSPSKRLK